MIKTILIILLFSGAISGQNVKFDSTYILTVPGEYGSKFDIGRVCQEVGCTGNFSTTGKHQTAWQILDNKIILVYVTPKNGIFHTDLLIYQYSERWKKFVLLE